MSDAKIDLDAIAVYARLSRGGIRLVDGAAGGERNVMVLTEQGQFVADCRDLDSTAHLIALTDPDTILALVEAVRAVAEHPYCIDCGIDKGYGHAENCKLAPFIDDERKDVTT